MTYFLAWTVLTWKCPLLLSFAPASVKPLVCQAEMRPQVHISDDIRVIQEKIESLGQGVPVTLNGVSFNEQGQLFRQELKPKWHVTIE